jgi:UDP-N-acetyl-D-galactosamine dehydrogenase
MGAYVVQQVVKMMLKKKINVMGARVLILGLTFKEDCPDVRNTRVIDMVKELAEYEAQVDVYDPWADKAEAKHEYGIDLIDHLAQNEYDAIILAVKHHQFVEMGAEGIRALGKNPSVLFDVKYVLPRETVDGRL